MQYLDLININKNEERRKEQIEALRESSGLSKQQINGIKDRVKNIPRYLFNNISTLMDRIVQKKQVNRIDISNEK